MTDTEHNDPYERRSDVYKVEKSNRRPQHDFGGGEPSGSAPALEDRLVFE